MTHAMLKMQWNIVITGYGVNKHDKESYILSSVFEVLLLIVELKISLSTLSNDISVALDMYNDYLLFDQ